LPDLKDLDGIIFAFITRRNTIMPFSQRLTPEQGVLAYLWGESSHSMASQPDKAGESVRTVGTDPFIVGSQGVKVNKFYDIIMELVENNPGKVHFFMYNTGGIGEIIDQSVVDGKKVKKLVRKVTRVPIDVMAAIQRGDMRGTNKYAPGRLGTLEINSCVDANLDQYNPEKMYSKEQIDFYIKDLVEGRRQYTEQIASQGLRSEIVKEAEKSFEIGGVKKGKVTVPELPKEEAKAETEKEDRFELPDLKWETKSRPRRDRLGRY
jgi:phosphoenolpyruvate carboxykinase (ATP)